MTEKKEKKKYNLSNDLIEIEYSKDDELDKIQQKQNFIKKEMQEKKIKLTLSVPESFVSEFKMWCLKKEHTMSESLVKSFPLLKKQFGE